MSVKKEVGLIFKDVGKGLLSIVIPPKKTDQDERIQMHWCDQCKKYHKVP